MQFYKKRDFSTLLNDTFVFFKENGKNYFKNYIIINGLITIMLVVLFVLGYKNFLAQIFSGNIDGENYYFANYFEENFVLLAIVGLVMFILFVILMVFNYSYPVFYMKRLSKTGNKHIKVDDILEDIKSHLGRSIKYIIGGIFIITPIALVIFGITYLLVFILIGLLLMLIIYPLITNIIHFHLFDYFHTKKGYFQSLSYAISSQFSANDNSKSPFWKYIGTTLILNIIIQVVMGVIMIIPIILGMVLGITIANSANDNINTNFFIIIFSVAYSVMILVSFFAMNLVYVATGLMYYDSRTDLHRIEELSEIETIGNAH